MLAIENKQSNPELYESSTYSLTISLFDQYKLFTIFGSNDNTLKLSGTGTLYLHFIDDNTDIAIEESKEISGYDKSAGEVVFFISTENARKIRKLNTISYHITCKFSDNSGQSAETEIFTGLFKSSDANIEDTSSIINKLSNEISEKNDQIDADTEQINSLNETISQQEIEIEQLKASLSSLSSELTTYKEQADIELTSSTINLSDYIHALATKGKNVNLSESQMSTIANEMFSKNI